MSKFSGIIIGGLEIAAGIAIDLLVPGGVVFGNLLIAAGVGTVIGGVGTLLNQPQGGLSAASRNPVMPWNVVYGRAKVGGTIIYINESGDSDKYLDLVFVLACHPCESVDAVLFDNQRLLFSANGNSIRPTHVTGTDHQQTIDIATITRSNGVVTVTLSSAFTIGLQDGDQLIIKNVSGQAANDKSLNGTFYISVIDSTTITYLCGGLDVSLSGTGQAQTCFPDYREKVHMEVLLGNQTSTFPGMLNGTPYDAGGSTVTVDNNPWNANCLVSGRTAVFLRLHYNDEVFSAGLPQISFRVKGKNDIYDPRTGATGYTENSALCIADYLSNTTYGYKASYGNEIPSGPLSAAANICDEAVTLASGATEPRYTCNGQFQLTSKRGEVLQNLLTSCGGRLTYAGGQFVINPAAWIGTSVQLYSGIANENGSPAASATLSILTSHILGSPASANAAVSTNGFSLFYRGWMNDGSAWTSRTDSSLVDITYLQGLNVLFAITPGTGVADLTTPVQFLVYDCWVTVTYQDGTTGTYRPTSAFIDTEWDDGTITNPGNAIDGDQSTYATIERDHLNTLDFSPVLRLNSFNFPSQTEILTPDIVPVTALGAAAGPFRWKSKAAIRDLYNGVKGTYVSPANGWQSSDFPPYAQDQLHGYSNGPSQYSYDANLAADGGDRRWLEIQLPFTISDSAAQRLAKIELLRRRQQGTGTFAFNTSLYQLTALDIVEMTIPYLGWSNKLLEVAAHRLTTTQQTAAGTEVPCLGCQIDVQETDPSVYDWSATEQLTPQGSQQSGLPNTSSPAAPTGATLTSDATTAANGSNGVSSSRISVSWTAPADGYVTNGGSVEVQYAVAGTTNWVSAGTYSSSVTQAYINGVSDGTQYDVQIRSVNAAGVPSDWVDTGTVTAAGSSLNLRRVGGETPAGTIDGTNATFTLTQAPNPPAELQLYLDNTLLIQGLDYSIAGSTITMLTYIPKGGDSLRAWYWY